MSSAGFGCVGCSIKPVGNRILRERVVCLLETVVSRKPAFELSLLGLAVALRGSFALPVVSGLSTAGEMLIVYRLPEVMVASPEELLVVLSPPG
ncbi:unnamed protein product [Lactuca virosa]|uniref:Uncharacterized protein n=1 Tax=Lactuca virosa TaxID=75947 RepID=A0AAU9PCA6_9ASTR|nr:unnamed protein product [Lactuca virosa]